MKQILITFSCKIFEKKERKHNDNKLTKFSSYCLQIPPVLPGLPQYLSLPSQSPQPLTPSQLPWLAQLAASSYGEGVVVLGKDVGSLTQGLHLTFSRLMEGRLENTNYVVIIVTAPGQETQSCVVVTGGICIFNVCLLYCM